MLSHDKEYGAPYTKPSILREEFTPCSTSNGFATTKTPLSKG